MSIKGVKNERGLYPYLIESAKICGWILYRIEDAGANKKPFDIGGITEDGKAVALEVKISQSTNEKTIHTIPLNLLKPHQEEWLKTYARKDGKGLFAIYYQQLDVFVFWILIKGVWQSAKLRDKGDMILHEWPDRIFEWT